MLTQSSQLRAAVLPRDAQNEGTTGEEPFQVASEWPKSIMDMALYEVKPLSFLGKTLPLINYSS